MCFRFHSLSSQKLKTSVFSLTGNIKLFENKKDQIKITIVNFEHGESAKGLYIDGILEFEGDYYHDKIDDYIEGFLYALKWFKESYTYPLNFQVEYCSCTNEEMNRNICENAGPVPKYLKDIEYEISKK